MGEQKKTGSCPANHIVFGIHITNRVKNVPEVQLLLTKYGCSIKTRIGLHEVSEDYCSPNGLILLEMTGDRAEIDRFHKQVAAVPGVQIQKMEFTH